MNVYIGKLAKAFQSSMPWKIQIWSTFRDERLCCGFQEVWPNQRWGKYDNDGWVPSSSLPMPCISVIVFWNKCPFSIDSMRAVWFQVAAFGCQWLRWLLPSAGRRYNCNSFNFLTLLKRWRTQWRLELLYLGSSSRTFRKSGPSYWLGHGVIQPSERFLITQS